MKKQPKDERKCFYPDCLQSYCTHNKDCMYDDLTTNEAGKKLLSGAKWFLIVLVALVLFGCVVINYFFHECNL